jgi:ribose/xylose/arabinose/galactoside ABC-type transport system permease subunit
MEVHGMTQNTPAEKGSVPKAVASTFRGHLRLSTELVLLVIIAVIFVGMTSVTDTFLSAYNIGNVFRQSAIIGIIAISSTIVIISGGIDLSVGSIAGLSAMVSAVLMSTALGHMPIWYSVLVALLGGTAVGVYHGFIIYEVKLPPFIATLGSMFVVRGIVKLISGAQTIANLPQTFTDFAQFDILGIPALVIVWLGVAVLIHVILNYTRFGRNVYVIGSSQEVARLSGIRMRLNVYGIYILAAFLCALAGALLSARLASAVPTGGQGYELTAIAAAVIGGASLSGARGSVLGTVLGTLLMGLITNAGVHLNIDPFLMQSITGALLTIAVVIDMLRQRRK